jgi:UDP-N-acetylmuramate--alanine ligase
VKATLAMARLMVSSGRSPLPEAPQRLLAVFQPHRYSRTAEFLSDFAQALSQADAVLLAPLYAAGEAPLPDISSAALAAEIQRIAPDLPVSAFDTLEALTDAIGETSQNGDLVLAMGAGDVNSLWSRLEGRNDPANALPLVA